MQHGLLTVINTLYYLSPLIVECSHFKNWSKLWRCNKEQSLSNPSHLRQGHILLHIWLKKTYERLWFQVKSFYLYQDIHTFSRKKIWNSNILKMIWTRDWKYNHLIKNETCFATDVNCLSEPSYDTLKNESVEEN